ncbi:MAG: hypothetical protein ACTHQ3_15960 [Motilibacteraceae bacterium]
MSDDRCGYTVIDEDGDEQPCDRPATGWRWYQNVGEHEDMLDVACSLHENEGGNRLHAAESTLARVGAFEFRLVRTFVPGINPAESFRVETAEPMSQRDALALMRDLGSPYKGQVYSDRPVVTS